MTCRCDRPVARPERDYLSGSRRPGLVLLQPETDYTNFKKSEFFGLLREIRVIRGNVAASLHRGSSAAFSCGKYRNTSLRPADSRFLTACPPPMREGGGRETSFYW